MPSITYRDLTTLEEFAGVVELERVIWGPGYVDVVPTSILTISVKRGGSGRNASIVHVHLDDGRDVDAFTTLRVVPPQGSHVVIAEARHASGRVTFDVMRVADQNGNDRTDRPRRA